MHLTRNNWHMHVGRRLWNILRLGRFPISLDGFPWHLLPHLLFLANGHHFGSQYLYYFGSSLILTRSHQKLETILLVLSIFGCAEVKLCVCIFGKSINVSINVAFEFSAPVEADDDGESNRVDGRSREEGRESLWESTCVIHRQHRAAPTRQKTADATSRKLSKTNARYKSVRRQEFHWQSWLQQRPRQL